MPAMPHCTRGRARSSGAAPGACWSDCTAKPPERCGSWASMTAAEQADDPLLVLVGIRTMQQALLAQGHLGDMIDLVDAAGRTVARGKDQPEQIVIFGGV